MTPKELMLLIESLSPSGPVTDSLTEALAARSKRPKKAWYRHQKEHWLGWLSEYDGPGAYDRKVYQGRTADFVYNHIMCPPMILWLGEGVGAPKAIVEEAANACLAAGRTLPRRCATIRTIVPWSMIEERLQALRLDCPKTEKPSRATPPKLLQSKSMNLR
ncbi:hypothetical protein RZS28_10760 [Methylocapsa polymorpha]|uniref:Uncharacterized protein n=1 Tax=Methylocapsa polymorpha TaxID=3080828 RepID=A0ABZ0HNH6_9HYPH|nr:hypothetical protein RZS28_10760 [Methylocapsa sp. RX1]